MQLEAKAGVAGSCVLLLVDTCGEQGRVALCVPECEPQEIVMAERSASSALLPTLHDLLQKAGMTLGEVGAIGVVTGPGSFTGVRVGLAVVKGLCEALDVPVAGVSRLAVLAEAGAARGGFAVLRASRDEVYLRNCGEAKREIADGEELMLPVPEFLEIASQSRVVFCEASLQTVLQRLAHAVQVPLRAADAEGLVRRSLARGGNDLGSLDANYVRAETSIYRRAQGGV